MQQIVYKIALVLAKIGVFLIALLSLLGASMVALTQYGPFREWAIGKGLEAVNDVLAGQLEVKDIQGNLLTGLTVRDATLIADDTTLITVPRIDLRYSLPPIFESRRIIASAVLHNPKINLLRNAQGVWNFSKITRPSTDTTHKPHTPLQWVFDVRNLEIRDATLAVQDATTLPATSSSGSVDFLHATFNHLNIGLNAFVSENEQSVEIDNLSFEIENLPFRLVELAGGISIDEEGLRLKGIRIETERSYLKFDASMDSISLFDSALASSFQRNRFHVNVQGKQVDTRDIRMFIPALDFLGGIAGIDLEASGTLSDIAVERLELKLTNSLVKAKGHLKNISDPDHLRIDIAISDSKLTYQDVPIHIPGLPIPDLRYLGDVAVRRLDYSGTKNDLTTLFDLSAKIGEVQGGAWFDYGAKIPRWRADVLVKGLNIEPILQDPLYKGTLNVRIAAEGQGFNPDNMQARARVKGASSEIGGRKLARLWFEGGIGDGGLIAADTLLVAWGESGGTAGLESIALDELQPVLERSRGHATVPGFFDRVRFTDADAAIFDGLPSLRAGGFYDMRNPAMPRYRLNVETDRLNVADVTLDSHHTTRLGLTLTVDGEGIDPDKMSGIVDLNVTDALLPGGEELSPFTANVSLSREGEDERSLVIHSDFLEGSLIGKWDFSTLLPTLSQGFDRLINYVQRKGAYRSDDFTMLMADDAPLNKPIYAKYEFTPKDLTIVEALMKGTKLEADASLKGTISGTGQLLTISSEGEIKRFRYESGENRLSFGGTKVNIEIRNVSATSMDDLLDADVKIKSDSLIRFNGQVLSLPKLNLDFQDGVLHANGVGTLNAQYSVALDGRVNVTASGGYAVEIDTLIFGLTRDLRWRNNGTLRLVLSDDKIDIESFQMFRKGAEVIAARGELLEYNQFRNMEVSVTGLSLRELRPFILDQETLAMIETLNGTMRDATLLLNGTLEDPAIRASINIDGLSYTTIPIGDLELSLNYRAQNLTGSMKIRRPITDSITTPLAEITIETLPIDMALASREERLLPGKPVKIHAETNDLPIAIAGPFIPGIIPRKGTANLKFNVSGIYPNLSYSGDGKILNGFITVESTNISYLADAEFSFKDRILNIDWVMIRNLPGDNPGGVARANGIVRFEGFTPAHFDINIWTPDKSRGILVLSDATQAVNQKVYGDLVIANVSDAQKIKFEGSLDEPKLGGNVKVLSSSLTLPYKETSTTVTQNVEFIDDSIWVERQSSPQGPRPADSILQAAGIKTAKEIEQEQKNKGSDQLEETFDKQQPVDSIATYNAASSIMDRLEINLQLTFTDRVFIKVQLGPLQELVLNIKDQGDTLYFWMKGDQMTLNGTINLGDRSRFVYYKTFDARGTVHFDGNVENPEFAIEGSYEGRRYFNDRSEPYTVDFSLTGPRDHMTITFDYTINGVASTDDPEQRRIDAIFLLLFGRRTSENLTSSAFQGLVDQGFSGVGSSTVNAVLGEVLKNIEFLQSLEVDLGQATDLGQARVNLVGQLGKALVRYSGKVSSPENGTIAIELPLSILFEPKIFEAFVAELQREVVDQFDASGGSGTSSEDTYRMRVRFRVGF